MIITLAIKLKMNDFHPDKVSGVNKDMIISQFDDDKMNEYKDKLSTDDADIMESALNKIIKKDKIVHKENKNQKLLYAIPQKKSKIDIPKKTYPKRHRKEVYSDVTSDLKKENEDMSSLVKNIPVLTPATTKVATPTKTKIVAPMKTKIATSVKTKITTPKITKFATPKTRFSCQQCGESFFRKLQLKIHMKVHAQEKNRLKAAAEYNIQVSTSLISINDTTKSKRKACYVAPTNSKGGMSVLSTSDAAPQKSVTESENGIENRCTMESYMEDVPLPSKILNNALAEDFKDNLNTQSENMDFPSVNVLTVPDISSADNLDIKSNESIEVILDSDEPNIKKIQKEKLFQCHDCDQEFKRRDYLRDHMITSHDGVKPFQCEICHKGFVRRNVLNNHMRSHTGEKPFQCSQCDKAFAHKSNLRSHIKLHTGERPFKCDICEKTFCAKSNLASHAKIHAGVKPHKCPECDQAFIHMDTLKKHMMVHTGERPFKCSVCEKAFRRNTHLTIHMRHHNNVRPFQCELCDKAFFEKSVLQSHMTQHTGIKPFQCDLCEKSFCHRSTLNIHLQIHRGERLFHCSVCQKSFCDKTTLIRHIRIHTGEKPFKCDVCNLHFRQSSNLKRHTRIHTGERPFKCTYCDKLFAQNINLTNHMRVHTGEKPFICGTCNKAFTQRSNLISHQKSHAGEDHVVEVYADYPRSSENNLDKEVNTFKIRGTNVSISLGNIEGGTDDAEVQRKLRIIGQKIADNVNQNKGFYIRTLVKNNSTEHEEESGSESNKVELEDHAESVLQTLISHNIGDLMDSRKVIVTNSDDDMPIITNYGSHSIKILPEQDKSSALGNFVVSHIPSCSKLAEHKKQIDDQSEHDYVEDEQEGNGFIIRDQSESVTMVQDDNGSVLYVDEEDIRDVSDKDHVYLEATDLQDGNLYVENHEDDEIYVESSDAGQEYTQNSVHINSSQVEGNALIGQDIISQDLLRQVESYVVRNYNQETYEQLLSVAAHVIPTAVENQPEHAYYENGYITSHEETIESAGSAVADDMQELLHYAVSQTVETTNEDAQ